MTTETKRAHNFDISGALDSGLQRSTFEHNREDFVVFLGKTLYSHSASLHPGVLMGAGKFNAGGNPAMN